MSKLEPTLTNSNPTATDVLRRLLDERGVEWTVPDESWNQDSITYWKVGSIKWVAFESENDTLWLNCNSVTDLTPEQAIAATLGTGTCHITRQFTCSECGHQYPTRNYEYYMTCDGRSAHAPLGYYVLDCKKPNYCPNCGRRCVG